jgi:YesN/AraC family two-component response regulator
LQALERARHETFDVVISDLRMPEVDGIDFLSLMSALQPHSVRMILTGTADF